MITNELEFGQQQNDDNIPNALLFPFYMIFGLLISSRTESFKVELIRNTFQMRKNAETN